MLADKIRPLIVRTKITLKIAQITEWEGKKVRHKPPLSLYVLHLVPDVNFNSNPSGTLFDNMHSILHPKCGVYFYHLHVL